VLRWRCTRCSGPSPTPAPFGGPQPMTNPGTETDA
jgi:hypothetical protein